MAYIGIDLHSNTIQMEKLTSNGKKLSKKFVFGPLDDFCELKKYLGKEDYLIVEASTNTFAFIDKIKDFVKEAYVANPYKLKLISMVKKKTDKIDAEKLATFLKMQIMSGEELIKPVHVPEQTIRTLRSYFATYEHLKKIIIQSKNRIHALLKQNLFTIDKSSIFTIKIREYIAQSELSNEIKDHISILYNQVDLTIETQKKIKNKIYEAGKIFKKEIDILTSMKGISIYTAIALISEISEIKRFQSSKHLASYLRTAPGIDQSNETSRSLKVNKMSRKLALGLLLQSYSHFKDGNPKLKSWYDKHENKKSKGKIRIAIMRKVFCEIFQMLKKGEYHFHRVESKHLDKMKKYEAFLGKIKEAA